MKKELSILEGITRIHKEVMTFEDFAAQVFQPTPVTPSADVECRLLAEPRNTLIAKAVVKQHILIKYIVPSQQRPLQLMLNEDYASL
uniref:Uncharacterized protein n=1 Tax=Sphaerodactylus townsendi TaxID=933632 RepID=A0ACB8EBS2_9SAUR